MMWLEHPIMMTLLLVLPTLLISFICYSICTAEPLDEDAEYPDSEEEGAEEGADEGEEKPPVEEVGGGDDGHEKTEWWEHPPMRFCSLYLRSWSWQCVESVILLTPVDKIMISGICKRNSMSCMGGMLVNNDAYI